MGLVRYECQDCGKTFSVIIDSHPVRCQNPNCGSYNTLAHD